MRVRQRRCRKPQVFPAFSFFYGRWRQHLALLLVIFGAVLLRARNPLCLIVNVRIKFVRFSPPTPLHCLRLNIFDFFLRHIRALSYNFRLALVYPPSLSSVMRYGFADICFIPEHFGLRKTNQNLPVPQKNETQNPSIMTSSDFRMKKIRPT